MKRCFWVLQSEPVIPLWLFLFNLHHNMFRLSPWSHGIRFTKLSKKFANWQVRAGPYHPKMLPDQKRVDTGAKWGEVLRWRGFRFFSFLPQLVNRSKTAFWRKSFSSKIIKVVEWLIRTELKRRGSFPLMYLWPVHFKDNILGSYFNSKKILVRCFVYVEICYISIQFNVSLKNACVHISSLKKEKWHADGENSFKQ